MWVSRAFASELREMASQAQNRNWEWSDEKCYSSLV